MDSRGEPIFLLLRGFPAFARRDAWRLCRSQLRTGRGWRPVSFDVRDGSATQREVWAAVGKRVVLIGSEGPLRAAVSRALTAAGHAVDAVGAESPGERRRPRRPAEIAIGILAESESDSPVPAALRDYRKLLPAARFILLGGEPALGDELNAEHLGRPIDMETLRERLRDG